MPKRWLGRWIGEQHLGGESLGLGQPHACPRQARCAVVLAPRGNMAALCPAHARWVFRRWRHREVCFQAPASEGKAGGDLSAPRGSNATTRVEKTTAHLGQTSSKRRRSETVGSPNQPQPATQASSVAKVRRAHATVTSGSRRPVAYSCSRAALKPSHIAPVPDPYGVW